MYEDNILYATHHNQHAVIDMRRSAMVWSLMKQSDCLQEYNCDNQMDLIQVFSGVFRLEGHRFKP